MPEPRADHLGDLARYLRAAGLDVDRPPGTDDLVVGNRDRGEGAPVSRLVCGDELYDEYLASIALNPSAAALASAAAETQLFVHQMLTKDHGGGVNRTSQITLSRRSDGSVGIDVDADESFRFDMSDIEDGELEWRSR